MAGETTTAILADIDDLQQAAVVTANSAVGRMEALSAHLVEALADIDPNYRLSFAGLNGFDVQQAIDEIRAAGGSLPTAPSTLTVPATPTVPTVPSAPALPTFSAPTLAAAPTMPALPTAPTLAVPDAPGVPSVSLPDTPEITVPSVPEAPALTIPAAPTLASLSLPAAPTFVPVGLFTDTFTASAPQAPGAVLNYTPESYESALQDAATAWLLDKIQNGGTGLAPAVEQAIWDRGMTREVTSARRNLESAEDEFAAAGWPLPPGALRARMREIRKDLQTRAEDLSRKVSEDQAKLAQENTRFAIDATLRLEGLLLQHFASVQDRALAFARATVDLAVAVYNVQVSEYNTRLEAWKAAAQVHESNVRSQLQTIENYRALLQGKEIEGNLRLQDIEVYKAQVSAAEAVGRLYTVEMEGAKVAAEMERLKLDLFRGEIDAALAQQKISELEVAIYRARLDGEQAKASLYQAQVAGVRAQTEQNVAIIGANRAQMEGQIEAEKTKVLQAQILNEQYRAQLDHLRIQAQLLLDAFRAEVEAAKTGSFINLEAFKGQIDAYNVGVEKAKAAATLATEAARIQYQGQIAAMNEANSTYRFQGQILQNLTEAAIGGVAKGLDANAQVAAAALSQITHISQAMGGVTTVE